MERSNAGLATMPEAHALKRINWQLFITLTFKEDCVPKYRRQIILKAFLAFLTAEPPASHFPKLLWISRWEKKLPDGRGHFHVCVAGLRSQKVNLALCCRADGWWRERTGSRADVKLYEEALGGLSYLLKLPHHSDQQDCWRAAELTSEFDELQPTLSESIFRFLRNAR